MDPGDEEAWLPLLEDCRTDAERAFVREMSRRARSWTELEVDIGLGATEPFVMLLLDVTSSLAPSVLRTLRADFHGSQMIVGVDETMEAATDLDPSDPNVLVVRSDDPVAMAAAAADWMERELRRPIVRHEWHTASYHHEKVFLADSGAPLLWSDSRNVHREGLGPPHRVVQLRPDRRMPPAG